ncbi:MAG: hypothetical protein CUN56_00470 [Phototrophicales bacterium]|nr:MAG: hypothetical protein CUN56_00470 [Phototrophicales bacterium]
MTQQYLSATRLAQILAEHDNTVIVVRIEDETVLHVESATPECMGKSVQEWEGKTLSDVFSSAYDVVRAALKDVETNAAHYIVLPTQQRSYALQVLPHGEVVLIALRPLSTLSPNPAKLRQVLETWPDAIFLGETRVLRLTGYHLRPNDQPAYPPQEILHQRVESILPKDIFQFFETYSQKALQTNEVQLVHYRPPESSTFHAAEIRFVPLPNDEILLIIRDVDQRQEVIQNIYERQGWWHRMAESIPYVIVIYFTDGKIIYLNRSGREMLGFTAGMAFDICLYDFVLPNSLNALRQYEQKVLAGKHNPTDDIEVVLQRDGWGPYTLEMRLSLHQFDDQTQIFIGTARDVSERKIVERELISANLRYELLLNNTPDGLLVTTIRGQIIDANPAFCHMVDQPQGQVVGRNLVEFLPHTPSHWFAITELDTIPIVKSNRFETVLLRSDELERTVSVDCFYIDTGDEPFLYFIIRDVTSERDLQAWLQSYANHWQVLYEVDNAILGATNYMELVEVVLQVLNKSAQTDYSLILFFDPTADTADIFTISRKDAPTIYSHTVPLAPSIIFDKWLGGQIAVMKNPSAIQAELPEGVRAFLFERGVQSCLTVPLTTDEGLIGVLALGSMTPDAFKAEHLTLIKNISVSLTVGYQQLVLKEQLREYAANLEQKVQERTEELARLNERLRELDQLKSMFVSDVSHELRTPINNIAMRLHLLEHDTPDQYPVHLERLKAQVQYLADLVEDILQLSRMDLGRAVITMRPVNLSEVAQLVVEANIPRAALKNITLEYEPPEKLPTILGERNQLSQVLANLLVNAINYTPEGSVQVRLWEDERDNGVFLSVTDTGMGIPDEEKERIFDRFYRGRQVAKSAISGTGLGLAIVREIVELHGGKIFVEDNKPKGTRFVIWLPTLDQLAQISPEATAKKE